jgi:hypothetical protein
MKERNKRLAISGIILLAMGLVASFYHATRTIYPTNPGPPQPIQTIDEGYPYQTIGIMLDLIGIVCIALGFLYSLQKTLRLSPSNPQRPSSSTRVLVN